MTNIISQSNWKKKNVERSSPDQYTVQPGLRTPALEHAIVREIVLLCTDGSPVGRQGQSRSPVPGSGKV